MPTAAERLPDGNTIVAETGRVREFDPAKDVVWERPSTGEATRH